ncbi:hypothetical protein COC69_12695 [Bacillus cereus]|uniref:Uncharacterized protein n=1 Tax=Bacillus cereus TaxID=1396 RepID=A0A9X7CNR1_BACCE|nr:hypothetical protein [Bacillus cereus]PGS79264.1 hypothetical protein COC69_12695 [Bacillus cereus]
MIKSMLVTTILGSGLLGFGGIDTIKTDQNQHMNIQKTSYESQVQTKDQAQTKEFPEGSVVKKNEDGTGTVTSPDGQTAKFQPAQKQE